MVSCSWLLADFFTSLEGIIVCPSFFWSNVGQAAFWMMLAARCKTGEFFFWGLIIDIISPFPAQDCTFFLVFFFSRQSQKQKDMSYEKNGTCLSCQYRVPVGFEL